MDGLARGARFGAIAVFAALVLLANAAPVSGTAAPVAVLAGAGMDGNGTPRAPLRQTAADAEDAARPAESAAAAEASRMAAMEAVLNRQGVQSAENLARVSAIAVPNLTLRPEFVVDSREERAAEANAVAEANAAATATAVAATAGALSVQATVEAQAAVAASTANALAATQQAEAEATAAAEVTAAADATAAAEVAAAAVSAAREAQAATLSATREARASAAAAATATARTEALAAAALASKPRFPNPTSALLLALVPSIAGVLGFRLWRHRKEPFVLKAIPVSESASASASA